MKSTRVQPPGAGGKADSSYTNAGARSDGGPRVVEVAIGTTGSAASYRVFASRWETIFPQRQRSTSNEQCGDNRASKRHTLAAVL